MKGSILVLFAILLCSYSKDPYEKRIKGKTIIKIYDDESLKDSCVIQGFAYSKFEKTFLEGAIITIDDTLKTGTRTDKNGFYSFTTKPGEYSFECMFVGNENEKTKKIRIDKGKRVFIIFELGTYIIY